MTKVFLQHQISSAIGKTVISFRSSIAIYQIYTVLAIDKQQVSGVAERSFPKYKEI